jgi:hypothetical protein
VRFFLSVIGLAVVLWWTFVWRFDGRTPAQYAAVIWHSDKVQEQLVELRQQLPGELLDTFNIKHDKPQQAADKHGKKPGKKAPGDPPEKYSDQDRHTLDALLERVQKNRND